MKQTLLLLILTATLFGCKKEKPEKTKLFTLKGTYWQTEYMPMHLAIRQWETIEFMDNNILLFTQYYGEIRTMYPRGASELKYTLESTNNGTIKIHITGKLPPLDGGTSFFYDYDEELIYDKGSNESREKLWSESYTKEYFRQK